FHMKNIWPEGLCWIMKVAMMTRKIKKTMQANFRRKKYFQLLSQVWKTWQIFLKEFPRNLNNLLFYWLTKNLSPRIFPRIKKIQITISHSIHNIARLMEIV